MVSDRIALVAEIWADFEQLVALVTSPAAESATLDQMERSLFIRIDDLRQTKAHLKLLSLEPLLGPLPPLNQRGIDWVIVGGESGPGARPIDEAWVLEIRDQCLRRGVPFFFKQWGGVNKKRTGRSLQGRTWDQVPVA